MASTGSCSVESIVAGNNAPSLSLVPRGSVGMSEVFIKLPLLAPTGGKRIVWRKDHFMNCFTRYQALVDLIVNNLSVVKAIADFTDPTEHDCLSKVVVNILHKADRVLPLLCHLIQDEIISSKTVTVKASVLRGTSILTQIEKAFVRIAGKDYLWSIFGDVITSIIGDPELDLEIDPAKIENKNLLALYDQSVEGLIKTRAQKIEDIVRTLVTRITDVESIRKMPVGIRAALAYISAVSRVHTPDLTTQLISGFVILRMFTPAIVTPEATGMIPRDFPPSVRAHRNLVLIAKVFQNIANNGGVASGKERFMEVMRAFVEASAPQMQRYFETLAAPLDPADPVAQLLHDSNPETLPDATVDVRELNINDLFELHRIIDRAAPKLLAKFKASAAPLLKSSSSAAAAAGQQRLSLSSASSSSSSSTSATLPLTTSSPLPNPGQGATANSTGQTISSPIGSPPPSSQQQQQPQLSSSPQVRLGQSRGRQTHSNSVTGSQGFVTASPRASTGFVRAVPDAQPRFSAGFLSVGSSQQQQQQQQQQPLSSGTPGYGPSSPSSLSFSLSSTSSSSSSQQQVELPPARKGDFLGGSRANQQQQQQRYTFLGKDSSRRNSTSASATPLSFPAAQVPAVTVQPDQQDDTHSNTSVPPIPTFPLSQQSQPQQPQSAKVPLSPHSAAAAATTTTTATASGWVTTSSKSVRWKKQVLDLLDQLGPPPSYSFGSDACKDETQAASTTAAAAAATAAAAAEAAGAAPATPPGGGLGVGGAAMAAVGTSDMGALERAKFLYQGASSVDGTPVFYLIFNRISMDFLTNVSPLISHVYRVMGPVVDKGPYILVIDMSWCSLSNDEKRIVYNSLKLIWSLLNRNYKKNIEKIYIVHPNSFVHALIFFVKTFVSRKFWRKVAELYNWKQLPGLLGLKPDLVTLPESSKNSMAKSYKLVKVNSRGKRQERVIKFTLDSILNIDPKTNKIKNEKRLDEIEEIMTDAGSVELWMRFSDDPFETKRLFGTQSDLATRIYVCNNLKERDAILRDIFSGGFKLGQGATQQEFSVVKINKAGKRQERKFKITVDSLMNVAGGDIRHEISFAGIEDVQYDPADPEVVLIKYKAEKEWRKAICKDAEALYNAIREGIRRYVSFGDV